MATKRARREALEAIYGYDNFDEGTVVRWYKCFGDPTVEPVYTYIAIKLLRDWYYNGSYITWADLLMEIDRENTLTHEGLLEVAVQWKEHSNEPPF